MNLSYGIISKEVVSEGQKPITTNSQDIAFYNRVNWKIALAHESEEFVRNIISSLQEKNKGKEYLMANVELSGGRFEILDILEEQAE